MKRLILHVGVSKTGTSSLQTFLARNVAALARDGIDYPALEPLDLAAAGRPTSGNAGQFARTLLPEKHRQYLSLIPAAKLWADLVRLLEESDQQTVVLSSEFFFVLHPDQLKRVKQAAIDAGYDCEVVAYLRRQDKFIQSSYSQLVKTGGTTLSAEDYCEAHYKTALAARYLPRLNMLSDVFGQDRITVRAYESQQLVGGSVIADFLHFLGVDDLSRYQHVSDRLNSSASPAELEFMRLLNIARPRPRFFERLSQSALKGAGSRGDLISPQLQHRILHEFADQNRRIAKRFLKRADGRLFFDPEPDPAAPWTPPTTLSIGEVAGIVGTLLGEMDRRARPRRDDAEIDLDVEPETDATERRATGRARSVKRLRGLFGGGRHRKTSPSTVD